MVGQGEESYINNLVLLTGTVRVLVLYALVSCMVTLISCINFVPDSSPVIGVTEQYSVIMVTSDLAVGQNRVSFGLVDIDNVPVRTESVGVKSVYFKPGQDEGVIKQSVQANFVEWPPENSGRGVYLTQLDFDRTGSGTSTDPGLWGLEITAIADDGSKIQARTALSVVALSKSPAIGGMAPPSRTLTESTVSELHKITSALNPDLDMYRISVRDALQEDKPAVIIFSTPAFCVSATCGPQLNVITNVKIKYQDEVNFIHVEAYQDPHLITEGIVGLVPVDAMDEWGLNTEPWTFVINKEGKIQAKFEQFVTETEILIALENAF
jgi:hypothetical protein